jgi:hypothetical protein
MDSGTPLTTGAPKPQVRAMNCPSCGAAITLRTLWQAVNVICEGCHSILDAKDPNLTILQAFGKATSMDHPLIPLGTRGKIRGTDYEVTGFQRRGITSDGITYSWHEYLLFNPYKPYRYLTEYQGHWNDIAVCKELPAVTNSDLPTASANYLGEVYKHFQSAGARTGFVLGEFPWQVRVGDQVVVTEYVRPPRVLSCEKTTEEVSWSIGEYMYGADVWKAFQLPGSPPPAVGVYENEPSPVAGKTSQVWQAFALFAVLLLGLMMVYDMSAKREPVFHGAYQLNPGEPKGEASFVTEPFELKGRTSTVEVSTSSNVRNNWIYINYALINQDTGQAWDFGREVSYYYGYDSDGSWSEGKPNDSVIVPSVPAGNYYLRIEPEVNPLHPMISYSVDVRRDVPVAGFFGLGFLALLIPAILISFRAFNFERERWSESDHPLVKTESQGD